MKRWNPSPEARPRGFVPPKPDEPKCSMCHGSGWAVAPDGGAGGASRCACQVELGRAEVLELAGVPEIFRLEHARGTALPFDPKRVNDGQGWPRDTRPGWGSVSVEEWTGNTERQPAVVTLVGQNGTGKSMLAAELLWRCRRSGHTRLKWTTAAELIDAHFNNPELSYQVANCDALVVDEVGRGHQKEFAWGVLTGAIRARLNGLKPTILTSNLRVSKPNGANPPLSFQEADQALYDSIFNGLILSFKGQSQRGVVLALGGDDEGRAA